MPDGGERGFDRVARTNMYPVLGREVIERKQCLAVLGQALGRFGVLRPEGGDESIECDFGIGAISAATPPPSN